MIIQREGLKDAMKIPRISWLAVALGLAMLSMSSTGQEEPQAPEPDEEGEAQPQPTPRSPSDSSADDVFIPSEEIAADEEVTFPVDI